MAEPTATPPPVDKPTEPMRRPRRRVCVAVSLEADTLDEGRKALARAAARFLQGVEKWEERNQRVDGLLTLEVDLDCLQGQQYADALERWTQSRGKKSPK